MKSKVEKFEHPEDDDIVITISGKYNVYLRIMDVNGNITHKHTSMSEEEAIVWADIRNYKVCNESIFECECMTRKFKEAYKNTTSTKAVYEFR